MKFKIAVACSTLLICFLSAVAQTSGSNPEAGNYRIGPGDVIDITVAKNPELSRTSIRVDNRGAIRLPMLEDDIVAACQTEKELAAAIREKYRKFLVEPFVLVAVREFNSSTVAVIGAVNSPGRFQFHRQIRLVELLTYVNGPSAAAGESAEIIRDSTRPRCEDARFVQPDDGEEDVISVELANAFRNGANDNPVILAGDIIHVPEAAVRNAYIIGNVRSSQTINLREPTTLTQAIAMAGGITSGAQLDKVLIRRQVTGTLNREEILINVNEINKRQRDDVAILPNDIIEIPGPKGVKKILGSILKTFVPTLTQLPVRVIP